MLRPDQQTFEDLPLLTDEPVLELADDRLSLDPYANTIAAVALGTEGPFTIGVFGDWGHGKTSLLRLAMRTTRTPHDPACCHDHSQV